MSELISIIVPTYQHADSVGVCLDSVLAQTYTPIEVIVVDDGSTDNTQEILSLYRRDDRVKIITQENQGSQLARMRGFQESAGLFVIFCDADIEMRLDMLQKMYDALQAHPKASYAYCGFRFGWKLFHSIAFDAQRLKRHNYIHTTSLVRRDDFPGFDPGVKRLQDWDVWLTMLEQGKTGVVIPEELFQAHIDGSSRIGSAWMPSWMYKLPWNVIGWRPRRLRQYEEVRRELAKKHNL